YNISRPHGINPASNVKNGEQNLTSRAVLQHLATKNSRDPRKTAHTKNQRPNQKHDFSVNTKFTHSA
ncbi:MAG: hypothetical protein ABH856_03245, partial [Patescibacteria group bacterium]